jgi:hypothetical protein
MVDFILGKKLKARIDRRLRYVVDVCGRCQDAEHAGYLLGQLKLLDEQVAMIRDLVANMADKLDADESNEADRWTTSVAE